VRKLFLKKDPNGEVEVIEDRTRILEILDKWQRRILRPEYIFVPPLREGDIILWDNWVG
jgi:xanthine dioxygenase